MGWPSLRCGHARLAPGTLEFHGSHVAQRRVAAAASPRRATAGSPAAPASSCLSGSLAPLADPAAFDRYLQPLRKTEWAVYSKPPFAGPAKILDYLGRYTHRVAISNHRLLAVDNGQARFHWRDYRHHGKRKTMTLDAAEFIRRFLLHVLPPQFRRVRYFGFLAARCRRERLALCRQLLGASEAEPAVAAEDYRDRFEHLTGRSLRDWPGLQIRPDDRCGSIPARRRPSSTGGHFVTSVAARPVASATALKGVPGNLRLRAPASPPHGHEPDQSQAPDPVPTAPSPCSSGPPYPSNRRSTPRIHSLLAATVIQCP